MFNWVPTLGSVVIRWTDRPFIQTGAISICIPEYPMRQRPSRPGRPLLFCAERVFGRNMMVRNF